MRVRVRLRGCAFACVRVCRLALMRVCVFFVVSVFMYCCVFMRACVDWLGVHVCMCVVCGPACVFMCLFVYVCCLKRV